MSDTTDVPRATAREWIGLAVLALPCLLVSMDLTVLNLAVPALSADLAPSSSELLWIVDIYGFLIAGALITMGTLGDRIGRRRLLLLGATAFGGASVLAAFSDTAGMLIATRAVLGVAGATLMPSTLSLIRTMFQDPAQRTVAIGVWMMSFSAGGAIGPLVGGVLLERFWWGSVFLLAVPVMALLLVVGPRLLPEYRNPGAGRLDLTSAGLSLCAVLAVVFGLKRIAEDGTAWLPVLFIAAGLGLGAVFVHRQRVLADPLIDLRLFRSPAFSASLATNVLAVFALGGSFLFTAQYLQLVLGLSPLQAGLWNLPSFAGFVTGAMLAPMLVRRVRPAFVMAAGLVVAAAGFWLLGRAGATSGLTALVTGSALFSLGFAPVFTVSTDLIVGTAPPEQAGAASAVSETGNEAGLALGIAVIGSIGTAVYRHAMAHEVLSGLPLAAAEAARGTLGGALAAAVRLPDPLGAELIGTAREAFTRSLQLTSAVSAAIVLAAAVLATILLRRVGTGGAEPQARAEVDPAATVPSC